MRTLIITKLFPNPVEPLVCPFNRQQFVALRSHCDVRMLATIPWFPGAALASRWSAAGRLTAVPPESVFDGMPVSHPRVAYLPRVGHQISGFLYAASLASTVSKLSGSVDVVLGSWLYPDGFASVLLARMLGVPAVVKVHGTDLNVFPQLGLSRVIRWTLSSADRVVTVSRALRDRAVRFGAAESKVDLVRNGVDRSLFRIQDRSAARTRLGIEDHRRHVLFVGRLEAPKGIFALLDAFKRASTLRPDAGLMLVGDGSARAECERFAAHHRGRVVVAGPRPLHEIPTWMAASDVVALPSDNEGTPNVVLEAHACGRRVVATAVGGIPDLISSSALGELVPRGDVQALSEALHRSLSDDYVPEDVARLASIQSWHDSAAQLYDALASAVAERAVTRRSPTTALGERAVGA